MNYILWAAYFLSLFFAVFWLITLMTERYIIGKRTPRKLPVVSIIIPAYNEEAVITETLKHVVKLDYPEEKLDIVVVNDGSKDKTAERVRKFMRENSEFKIRLVSQRNKGKGSALNHGLRLARGDYFVCLDADSLVGKNTLRKILPYFAAEDVAAVLPVLKVDSKKGNLLQKMQHYEYVVNMFYKQIMARLDCVNVTPGPFSVYRMDVIKKLGGFDENGNLTEDLEMALRLQSHHYKIVQMLDAEVKTLAPRDFKGLYKQRNRWYKGSVLNALNYKKLVLNRKYGDFGMMQMPTKLISGLVTVIVVLFMVYYLFKPIVRGVRHLSLIDFDIFTYIMNWISRFSILDLNYSLIFLGVSMAVISLFVLRKSHIRLREKIFKHGAMQFVFYVVMYFIVLGIVWFGVAFDLVVGRKQRW